MSGGEWIIDYGSESDNVFFIVSGIVRAVTQMGGRNVLLREMKAGEFFGELAALDGQPRSAGIMSQTDVVLASMPSSVFRRAMHDHADVCDQIVAHLAGQIRALANRVTEFSSLDVRIRVYAELLRMARPETGDVTRAIISPPPVHADIASRIGTRREAVARECKDLERQGLLERRRGALVLTDTARLQTLIEEAADN